MDLVDRRAGRPRQAINLSGFLMHRMLKRSYARVNHHVWTLYPDGFASGDRPRVWRHGSSPVHASLQYCPLATGGRDQDRAWDDHPSAGAVALGPDPLLGQGPEDRASMHQRQSGDRSGETFVPCCLQGPALPGDCDGVL